MSTKHCARCKTTKPTTEFGSNKAQRDGLQTYCWPCLREYKRTESVLATKKAAARSWYLKNAERVLAQKKAEYAANPEPRRAKARKANRDPAEYERHKARALKRTRKVKAEVFEAYGGYVCACCDESNPGFLTIDHIDGCGKELRKEHGLGSRFYNWLRTNGFPPGFQVLCFNCNLGRSHNGGICPHKQGV